MEDLLIHLDEEMIRLEASIERASAGVKEANDNLFVFGSAEANEREICKAYRKSQIMNAIAEDYLQRAQTQCENTCKIIERLFRSQYKNEGAKC